MTEAEDLRDRVGVIQRGRLVAEGTPAQLMNRSGHELHIIGTGLDRAAGVLDRHSEILAHTRDGDRLWLRLADPDPSGLVADLVAAGVSIREVANESRLEDAFVVVVVLPVLAVVVTAPDAFAGERERKTLRTLLASRLTDRAGRPTRFWTCSGGWTRRPAGSVSWPGSPQPPSPS